MEVIMDNPATESTETPSVESRMESLLFGEPVVEKPQEEIPEETPEIEETEESEQPEEESEALSFNELSELAEATGMDLDKFMDTIKTKVSVAGEPIEVNLKELRDGYMKDADYRKKTSEIAELKRNFEAEKQTLNQQYAERIKETDSILETLENAYTSQFNQIDWQTLRMEDPAEYAAKLAEKKQAEDYFKGLRAQTRETNQRLQREQSEKYQQMLGERLVQEREALISKLPSWDQKSAETLSNYLGNNGFNSDEISQAYDHRIIVLAEKARLYDELVSNKDIASNKVRNLPKITKPGAQIKTNPKADMKKQIRQTKDPAAKARLIQNMLAESIAKG